MVVISHTEQCDEVVLELTFNSKNNKTSFWRFALVAAAGKQQQEDLSIIQPAKSIIESIYNPSTYT